MILTIGTAGFSIYPIYNMLGDFNKYYHELERVIPKSYFSRIIVKLFINCCSFFIASGIGYVGAKAMYKFSTKTTRYFFVERSTPYFETFFIFAFVFPTLFLFCYMLSSALPIVKEHRSAGTLLGVIVLIELTSLVHLKGAAYYVFLTTGFLIMFILSINLAERYFEQS